MAFSFVTFEPISALIVQELRYAALVGQSYSFFYTIMVFTMVLSLIFIALFAVLVVVKQIVQQR